MSKVKFELDGMNELIKDLNKLGKVPQKYVTASSKKAMTPVLKQAKNDAPGGADTTGNLKKGIILVGEKSKSKSKKVYRVVFDRKMNDVFQKPNKDGKITGYYPISQEYGFFARNGKYIPGFRFVGDSMTGNAGKVERIIVSEMKKKIDAEIAKGGLK